MMPANREKGQRLETLTAEWMKSSPDRGTASGGRGATFARTVSARLQVLYPAADLDEDSEALRRLMAELAAKDR